MTVQSFEAELAGLIGKLDSKSRRQLARDLAKQLRQSQQKRIAAQLNPDGSGFAPRKPQLRARKGAIRRQMFAKLRTSRYLQTEARPDAAVVGFIRRVGRIAAAHQYGLRDVAQPGCPEVQYPARQLLGFTSADVDAIRDLMLTHLAG